MRGRRQGDLAVFLGMPFAEPPVGPARFAEPRPARAWDGVREASSFGPPPPQSTTFGAMPKPTGDDWLTINVWTPEPDPAARRPVMVWIYGGAYKVGSADTPGYEGDRLAREGDVVVVSFNYRVGVEGFAQIEGAPANRGLLDQVAALRWVRDNIAAFGGDQDRVTVFGQSAGAGSIAALLAMPRAAGLFDRAIAQSVPGTFFSAPLAADIASAIAGKLGLRATRPELGDVDPLRLTAAADALNRELHQHEHRWGQVAETLTPFSPVVDGEVLPTTPWEALAAGAARDVRLIAGHNRDEYRLMLLNPAAVGTVGDEQAARALRMLAPRPDGERAYRAAYPDLSAEGLYELLQTDWLFRMPTLHLAEAHAAGGGLAYLYELTWPSPAHDGALGACHGLDGPLVLGNLTEGLAAWLLGAPPSAEAEEVSSQIPRGLDGVRGHRRPRLARPRSATASDPDLRHTVSGRRLPRRDLTAPVAGSPLRRPARPRRGARGLMM